MSNSSRKSRYSSADRSTARTLATGQIHGLSDYLVGQREIAEVIVASGHESLDFIACGERPPNPSEILTHQRMEELLTWASDHYDLVVVDTPPVLAVTDPAIIGLHAGTVFLVCRFGQNAPKEMELARQKLEQSGVEVSGCILNGVVRKARSYYGRDYAYYNSQYSYKSES